MFTNTVASNQFNYVNQTGDLNQSYLNIPQMPNQSNISPAFNNTTQNYNNNNNNINNNRSAFSPPVVNNNISRSTITPPGVSSATINQNGIRPSVPLPNIQQMNSIPVNNTNNMINQNYQPPVPLGNSYNQQQPSQQQPINQGYIQPQPSYDNLNRSYQSPSPPPQQPINQGYIQPQPSNYDNMSGSVPMPQPNEVSASDIPTPPLNYSSAPNGDFILTDHIVKNEYHTYILYDPPLGSGSYATAYLVSCESFTFVMKKMNIKKYQDNVKKMLQEEMKILSALPEHPNVIQYMDGFQQGDYYYLVMNYCRDGDLLEIIHKYKEDNEPIPEDKVLKYITDIANGILFIHQHNIVHRDLKPGNIFLDKGRCVIGDFGIAKMINNESVSCSTFIGTPSYMAPEMFKEENYDSSVDIWAFGCIVIELCTLNLPFNGNNIVAIMKEIENANVPELTGYSSFIKDLVHQCIVYDPQSRLTAEKVIDYLHSYH